MIVTRTLDHGLYPRKALADARQAYKDYCDLRIEPKGSDSCVATISVKPEFQTEGRQVILEFLNYVLDLSAEYHFQRN